MGPFKIVQVSGTTWATCVQNSILLCLVPSLISAISYLGGYTMGAARAPVVEIPLAAALGITWYRAGPGRRQYSQWLRPILCLIGAVCVGLAGGAMGNAEELASRAASVAVGLWSRLIGGVALVVLSFIQPARVD